MVEAAQTNAGFIVTIPARVLNPGGNIEYALQAIVKTALAKQVLGVVGMAVDPDKDQVDPLIAHVLQGIRLMADNPFA